MQRTILRDLLVLLGVFGLIWLVSSLFSYPEDPKMLSIQKEEKLGKSYVDLILLNPMYGEFENRKVDSAVGLITSTSFDRKLEVEMDNELIKHFEIISTHPNFRSRIREALSYKPAKDFEAEAIELDWELIRAEL